MERLCGMLLPLVRSRQYPYTNLTNQITVWNQFSHLQYFPDINERVFGNSKKNTKESEENRNFGIEGDEELLLAPGRKRTLSKTEKQLLIRYYITAQEIDKLEEVFFRVFTGILSCPKLHSRFVNLSLRVLIPAW